jgi:serine/threonine protein phosphatase 1
MPNPTPKLFALGDIHAHWHQLTGLIHNLYLHADFQPDRDTLVVLGDEIDGGQHAKEVVTWCMEMSKRHPHWVFLKGNHNDLMLDAWMRQNSDVGG